MVHFFEITANFTRFFTLNAIRVSCARGKHSNANFSRSLLWACKFCLSLMYTHMQNYSDFVGNKHTQRLSLFGKCQIWLNFSRFSLEKYLNLITFDLFNSILNRYDFDETWLILSVRVKLCCGVSFDSLQKGRGKCKMAAY